jgi:hypothetical protein
MVFRTLYPPARARGHSDVLQLAAAALIGLAACVLPGCPAPKRVVEEPVSTGAKPAGAPDHPERIPNQATRIPMH